MTYTRVTLESMSSDGREDSADSSDESRFHEGRVEGNGKDSSEATLEQIVHATMADTEKARSIQNDSVYGVIIVIPQVARTLAWSKPMTIITIRCFMFYSINMVFQFGLVYSMYNELYYFHRFAGQPSLCNFGMDIQNCPDGPNCVGPGGTKINSASDLYDFDTWYTRVYVRDALLSLFPERADDIAADVAPGEYGVESHWNRILCCFIFLTLVMDDFYRCFDMLLVMHDLPSENGEWLALDAPKSSDDEQSFCVRCAGMPFKWKIINVILVLLPQVMLEKTVAYVGISFLMDTSDITDAVINTTALVFILQIDEMIFSCLMSNSTKLLMSRLSGYALQHNSMFTVAHTDPTAKTSYRDLVRLVPWKTILNILITTLFLYRYYTTNCQFEDDGSWISKPRYAPTSEYYNPLCVIFPCEDIQSKLTWHMPDTTSS